jgi:hypothetical protein
MEQNVCFKYILVTANKVSITEMKTGPGAHPACYTTGTWSLLGVKQLGQGINHPSPSSTEVKKTVEQYLCSTSLNLWQVIG